MWGGALVLLLTCRWRQKAVLWSQRRARRQRRQPEKLDINIHLAWQFPPKTNFRFYLVIYHFFLPHGEKNQEKGNVELKDCSVYSFLFSIFHFVSLCCLLICIKLHLDSIASHIKQSSRPNLISRQIPPSANNKSSVSFVCMPHKPMCASDACFFYFETEGVKAWDDDSDSWEKNSQAWKSLWKLIK